jgi:hypothetical protein
MEVIKMKEDKGIFEVLTATNQERITEEETRPRVEMMFDDWAAWVAYHEAQDRGWEFSPHFGIGWN